MRTFSVKNSLPAGDLLSALPGMRQAWADTGKKAIIYQRLNMIGEGWFGGASPFKNDEGLPVCMNEKMFYALYPLLKSQEYVEDFLIYTGEPVEIDLDKTRSEYNVNVPKGLINRWPFYIYPQMTADLSQQWLSVKPQYPTSQIVLNFTDRYRNDFINYFFLKEYEDNCVFVGLPGECDRFNKQWNLNVPFIKCPDLLFLAELLSACKLFLGCQSMAFQIAEGLKIPRILEVCSVWPNVIPQGANGYDFYHQGALEFFVKKLFI